MRADISQQRGSRGSCQRVHDGSESRLGSQGNLVDQMSQLRLRKHRVRLAVQSRAVECSRQKEQHIWRPEGEEKHGTSQELEYTFYGRSQSAVCVWTWQVKMSEWVGGSQGIKKLGLETNKSWQEPGHIELYKLHKDLDFILRKWRSFMGLRQVTDMTTFLF